MSKYPVLILVVPLLHCAPSAELAESLPDLSSPEAAIRTKYAAVAHGDIQLLQAAYVDDVQIWTSPEEVAERGKLLERFRILEVSPMKDVEGEMFVKVEETMRGTPTPIIMFYALRQTERGWQIVNHNVDEGIEPFDPRTLDDRLRTPR